ncbi:MAG: DUF885 domain-containing protein [Lachnospiraceae bacterium]
MKRILSFFLAVTFLFSLTCTACTPKEISNPTQSVDQSTAQASMSFDDFVDSIFRETLADDTLSLHFLFDHPENYGITNHTVTLGDASLSSIKKDRADLQSTLQTLSLYNYSTLSNAQKLTYDVLKDSLELSLKKSRTPLFFEPLDPLHGAPSQLPVLFAEYRFLDSRNVDDYLNLLSQFGTYFSSIETFEKEKANAGLFMADFAAKDIVEQCQHFLEDTDNHFLKKTFEEKIKSLDALSEDARARYIQKNQQILTNTVFPAYRTLIKTITSMIGSGKNDGGLCGFEGGKDYYQLLVKEATGSDASVTELERKTDTQRFSDLREVQILLQKHPELASINQQISLPQQSPEEMLADLKKKISSDFPTSSVQTFSVKYVEPCLEDTLSPAFYLTAPLDDPQENSIYINGGSQYKGLQLYTTLAHEGFPGHMYQTNLTQQANLPPIRALLSYSGYTEGWATYVEMLSYYYADLDSNTATLLQKHQSALLSLYATCDMKIHYNGWNLKDVATFLSDFGITDSESVSEIYHLIVETPANYLSYYIGYLEFMDLKKTCQKKQGSRFREKEFHQKVLSLGSAPFAILEKYCLAD